MDKKIKSQITYGKNVYGKEEIQAVLKRIKQTTQMSLSVSSFEKKIARKFNKKYGIMVNSGSSAIHLALKILNFKKNSEVIVPCLNFGTAISSLMFCDLKPIFVDVNIDTLQINENLIEKKITSKTKAIMVPNLIGNLPNWQLIKKISTKHNLKIIEDSADTEVVITGRCKNEPSYFELADVYSEMVCHKHYANVGVDLKRGVDY